MSTSSQPSVVPTPANPAEPASVQARSEVFGAGEGTSQKDLPPQFQPTTLEQLGEQPDDFLTAMAQAESRRLTLQTEAAINLGIGFALWTCGRSKIIVDQKELSEFVRTHRVTGELVDGMPVVTITPRIHQGE